MRIVHYCDYFQPKLGYQETFLTRLHAEMGHEVHVITGNVYRPHPDYDDIWKPILGDRNRQKGTELFEGVTIHRLRTRFEVRTRPWHVSCAAKIASLQPDYLIVHGMSLFGPMRIACYYRKVDHRRRPTIVFDSHANAINSQHRLRSGFYSLYRRSLMPLIRSVADGIVAVDVGSKSFLEEQCGFKSEEISVIGLGADTHLFQRCEQARTNLRTKLEIPATAVVFTYAGKIEAGKGIEIFIDAAVQLIELNKDVAFLLVGGGDIQFKSKLIERVPSSLRKYFVWCGFVENSHLPEYYSASDVSVWPKRVSIGTFEAQACSLPLIVADSPILRDRVTIESGLRFSDNSVSSLLKQMLVLLDAPERRLAMGAAGRADVELHSSWSSIAHQFLDF